MSRLSEAAVALCLVRVRSHLLTCSSSSGDILDDICHLPLGDRSSVGFPPISQVSPSPPVSSSLCLVSTTCSAPSCRAHIQPLLGCLIVIPSESTPTKELLTSQTHFTHIFLFRYGGSIFHLLRPKPLKSSLILFFLSSLPVFQEILLVLPSEFIWDLTTSLSLTAFTAFTPHLDYSSIFLTDLFASNLAPPMVRSYKEIERSFKVKVSRPSTHSPPLLPRPTRRESRAPGRHYNCCLLALSSQVGLCAVFQTRLYTGCFHSLKHS